MKQDVCFGQLPGPLEPFAVIAMDEKAPCDRCIPRIRPIKAQEMHGCICLSRPTIYQIPPLIGHMTYSRMICDKCGRDTGWNPGYEISHWTNLLVDEIKSTMQWRDRCDLHSQHFTKGFFYHCIWLGDRFENPIWLQCQTMNVFIKPAGIRARTESEFRSKCEEWAALVTCASYLQAGMELRRKKGDGNE